MRRDKQERGFDDRRPHRVLLAEQSRKIRELVVHALRGAGFDVEECPEVADFLSHLGSYVLDRPSEDYSLVVAGVGFIGRTECEVIAELRRKNRFPPLILILTGSDGRTHERAARYLEPISVCVLPAGITELVAKAEEIVSREHSRS